MIAIRGLSFAVPKDRQSVGRRWVQIVVDVVGVVILKSKKSHKLPTKRVVRASPFSDCVIM